MQSLEMRNKTQEPVSTEALDSDVNFAVQSIFPRANPDLSGSGIDPRKVVERVIFANFSRYFAESSRNYVQRFSTSQDPSADPHPEWYESVRQQVFDLRDTASTENWDGEGAIPVSDEVIEVAAKLVDLFPSYVVEPDVDATPHGEVDFDWMTDDGMMLTVSVGSARQIAFAALFSRTRLTGTEPWNGALPHFVGCCFKFLQAHA